MKSGWKNRCHLFSSRSRELRRSIKALPAALDPRSLPWEKGGKGAALQGFPGTVLVVAVLGRFRGAQGPSSWQNQFLCGEHWERHTEGYYCVSCAWKYSDRTEAGWGQSFHKQPGEIPPPLLTCLPFILKQDRTREYNELKEGRPRERWMANVLVEHNLRLKPHEIFPENTHIWLSFNSTLNGCQVFFFF